ncbi:MAG: UDP-N-acetylmuramoyl-L-alanyl-D-glutamate--2,6-diaminopimelate ligase [Gammaproteobacteria bacterium]|nr:UDP-N-acetylmuramoyl-L-alanyl-D-glutamate--2,6-diaminopimelate ligase [Gammaproteobacteria bacterium]
MMAAIKNNHSVVTLKQLLNGLPVSEYLPEIEVQGLTLDSREVEPGYVFIALEGQLDHGLAYAETAISRGAVAVLCDEKFDQYCQQILSRLMSRAICVPVRDLQEKLAGMACRFYGNPSEKIFISGVTGTDGKTSVSHFIAQAMKQAYGLSAVIGTLGNGLIDDLQESSHTTPDIINLQKMLAGFYERGVEHVAMEVSSHGLDQKRVANVDFDVAVLTNLSRDHLDYHGDIESYKQAKKKLFTENSSKSLVLNVDDAFGVEIFNEHKNNQTVWLYGLDEANARQSKFYAFASNIRNAVNGIDFTLNSSKGVADVNVKLIGEFNIYNVLACACVLLESGINFNHVVKYIEKLHTVAGRMELLAFKDKPSVVIDYAHTPEALTQALINVRKHTSGKVICVFGCGGDRDIGKRPLMAKAAEELSDLVILTNDNPRSEDPLKIIDDIKQGISNEIKLIVEIDRKKAIQHAIEISAAEDMILIAGKGHESYQIIRDKKIAFSDKEIALSFLGVLQ